MTLGQRTVFLRAKGGMCTLTRGLPPLGRNAKPTRPTRTFLDFDEARTQVPLAPLGHRSRETGHAAQPKSAQRLHEPSREHHSCSWSRTPRSSASASVRTSSSAQRVRSGLRLRRSTV